MKYFNFYLILVCLFFNVPTLIGQNEKCTASTMREERFIRNPFLRNQAQEAERLVQNWISENRYTRGSMAAITIPVVVHVLWHEPVENISDEQIYSQIDGLNEDFRLLNADSLEEDHPFWGYTIDTEIEFCLASRDPLGNPTTGITRTQTPVVSWSDDQWDAIKFTSEGGKDNWDPTKYLNIYVVNLEGSTLGFASFPDELASNPDNDGVVIRYEAFGYLGTAGSGDFSANDLGRTGTHEVGHWLFLRHIWGDDFCGDDLVEDTEPAEEPNYGCPEFPHNDFNGCGTGEFGEMYMNYMDYVDDNCMNMFTYGQAVRMYASIENLRQGLITSNGCESSVNLDENELTYQIGICPNPNNGQFKIDLSSIATPSAKVRIYNVLGELVRDYGKVSALLMSIDMSDVAGSGIYFVSVETPTNKTITSRIFVSK